MQDNNNFFVFVILLLVLFAALVVAMSSRSPDGSYLRTILRPAEFDYRQPLVHQRGLSVNPFL